MAGIDEIITKIFQAVQGNSIDVLQQAFPNWAHQTSQDLLRILNAVNDHNKTALELVVTERKFRLCEYLLDSILHDNFKLDYSKEDLIEILTHIVKYCQDLDTQSAPECWLNFLKAFNILLKSMSTIENLQIATEAQDLFSPTNILSHLKTGTAINKHLLETSNSDQRRNEQLGLMKKMYFLLSILFNQRPISPEVKTELDACLYQYILLNHQNHPVSTLLHRAVQLYNDPDDDLRESNESWSLHVIPHDLLTLAFIHFLISLGADAKFPNMEGSTPLHILASKSVWAPNNYLAVFKAIVEAGHLDQKGPNGETAISLLRTNHQDYKDWKNIQPFNAELDKWVNAVLPLACLSANVAEEFLPIEEVERLPSMLTSFQLLHHKTRAGK